MSVFDDIGIAEAKGELAEALAMGETISLEHEKDQAVTLKALVGDEIITPVEAGKGNHEERVREFRIPVQTGFAVSTNDVEPITPGDVIAYNSRDYSVADPVTKIAADRIYLVTGVEIRQIQIGVR